MYGHDIVEAKRHEISHSAFENRSVETGLAVRRIGVADRSEIFDARLLQVVQIVAVVDDAHSVCLDEADPDGVAEGVVSGIEGRLMGGNRVVHLHDRSCRLVFMPLR